MTFQDGSTRTSAYDLAGDVIQYTDENGSVFANTYDCLGWRTAVMITPATGVVGTTAVSSNPLVAAQGNGNIANDGTKIYAYDALNRLTTVSSTASGTPQVAAYTYDALGRRVLKVTSNGGIAGTIVNATYRYLYDVNQIVEELLVSETTTTLRQFVWGQYIDELIQLNVPATTTTPPLTAGVYYPLQDLLYRTIATTNSSGSIVEAYDYDAYGNTLIYSGPGTDGLWFTNDDVTSLQPMCEYLFTGRQYDPETEIYWYRARYYGSTIGRFLSRDAFTLLDPQLYQIAEATPATYLDPLGLAPQTAPATTPTTGVSGPQVGGFSGIEIPWNYVISDLLTPAGATADPKLSASSDLKIADFLLNLDKKGTLDKEAVQKAMAFGQGQFCPKSGKGKSTVQILMLAPKTDTLPPSGAGCCCNINIDVVWSSNDAIGNQYGFAPDDPRFWSKWGKVTPVIVDVFGGHGPAGIVGESPEIVRSVPYQYQQAVPGGPPIMLTGKKWARTGQHFDTKGWIKDRLDPSNPNYAGADGYVFACHSQGCNILMQAIGRACSK